jgi:hypothetical protein
MHIFELAYLYKGADFNKKLCRASQESPMGGVAFYSDARWPQPLGLSAGSLAKEPVQSLDLRTTKIRRKPSLIEKQLEAARRSDFEALLQVFYAYAI